MENKARTKDEKYIISLYERALKEENIEFPFDRYEIGHNASLHERGIDTICKLLLQANFIKKSGETHIFITTRGVELAKRLLEES